MTHNIAFPDMVYKRIETETIKNHSDNIIELLDDDTVASLHTAIDDWRQLRNNCSTMYSLANVAYSLDTTDEAVKKEKEFLDQRGPTVAEFHLNIKRKILTHTHKQSLIDKYGQYYLDLLEVSVEVFDPCIAENVREQAKLTVEYSSLLASAKIDFNGEVHNLATLGKYSHDLNRELRHSASKASMGFFNTHKETLDEIYAKLVKSRHDMAQKMGYENFVSMGYKSMSRLDYGPVQTKDLRDQIAEHVVPIATKFRQEQAKEMGLETVMAWDEAFIDPKGAPKPLGGMDFIVEQTKTMYKELSPETNEFFTMLSDRKLYDLEARQGKSGGGFCTTFGDYRAPFIFSNFNGTKGDVDVMTHECGHALQANLCFDKPVLEYCWPTMETAEIASMAMELLSSPWMHLFFGTEEAERFHKITAKENLIFLCYGSAVDEFQHYVYENPDCGTAARHSYWLSLEAKYLPWRNNGDLDFNAEGRIWQKQAHIYVCPFYYIDYVIAQLCAMQFHTKAEQNRTQAMTDYFALIKTGGSKPFLQLLEIGKLDSPFDPGVVQRVVNNSLDWLSTQ